MESEGQPGRVNISEDTRRLVESCTLDVNFTFEFNKVVKVKGITREYKSYLITVEA